MRLIPHTSFLAFLLLVFLCGACSEGGEKNPQAGEGTFMASKNEEPNPASPADSFRTEIGKAHAAEQFLKHRAVAFNIQLVFGGKPRLKAQVTMLTNSGKIKLVREDSACVIFDGTDVFLAPADADWPRARFDAMTWAYFFAVPYKLNDPGTEIEPLGRMPMEKDSCRGARLTFHPGTGDAPEDWYILYKDDKTNLLRGMAYIVTYGKSFEEANANPHAITYNNYTDVDGIPIASRWEFRGWSLTEGVKDRGGEGTISNVRFIDDDLDSLFAVPSGAAKVPMKRGE